MQAAGSRPDRKVLFAFLLVVLFLGVNFVAIHFSNRELQPFWGATLRFAPASAILFLAAALRRIPLPRGGALTGAVLLGVTAFGANFAFLYWGLLSLPSATASILFATIPMTTFVMASAIGLESFRPRALIGAIVAMAGVVLIFEEQLVSNLPILSLAAVLVAAFMAAASGVVVKWFPRGHPIGISAVGMAVGTAILLAASVVAGEHQRLPSLAQTWGAVGWLVASSAMSFVLLVWVIYRWSASAASYGSLLSPIVTFVVASVLAGETVSLLFLAGSAVVLAGVYLGAIRR